MYIRKTFKLISGVVKWKIWGSFELHFAGNVFYKTRKQRNKNFITLFAYLDEKFILTSRKGGKFCFSLPIGRKKLFTILSFELT